MKIRNGFVGNSSSTSFLIKNKTDKIKTAIDLAEETKYLVKDFNIEYGREVNEEEYIQAAINYLEYLWQPKETKIVSFGDNDSNEMGLVLDYMLREKNESDSFEWEFNAWER